MDLDKLRLGTVLSCANNLVRAVVMAKCKTGVIVFNYTTNNFEVVPYSEIDNVLTITEDNMSMIDETNELRSFTSKFINATVDYLNEHYNIYENIIGDNDTLKYSKDLFDKKFIDRKQVKDTRTNRIYSIVDVERINGKLHYTLNRIRCVNRTLHEESLFVDSDELKQSFVFEEDLLHPVDKNNETLENNEFISTGDIKDKFIQNNEQQSTSEVIDERSESIVLLDNLNLNERFRKHVTQWHSKKIGTLSNTMMEKIYDLKWYDNIVDYYKDQYLQFLHTKNKSITKIINEYINLNNIEIFDYVMNRNDIIKFDELMDAVVCKNNNEVTLPFILRCLTFINLKYPLDYQIYDNIEKQYISDIGQINTNEIVKERYYKFKYSPIIKNKVGQILLYKDIPMVITQLNRTSVSVLFNVFSNNDMVLGYLPYKLLDKLNVQGDIKILDKYNFTPLFNIINEEYRIERGN